MHIRTHKNDHVRTFKILQSISESEASRKHDKTEHALVGLGRLGRGRHQYTIGGQRPWQQKDLKPDSKGRQLIRKSLPYDYLHVLYRRRLNYAPVSRVLVGSFHVSGIHRTLTCTTGYLTCQRQRDHSYACEYTRGLGTHRQRVSIFSSWNNNHEFSQFCLVLLTEVRTSGLRLWSPTLCQLSHSVTPDDGFFVARTSSNLHGTCSYEIKDTLVRVEGRLLSQSLATACQMTSLSLFLSFFFSFFRSSRKCRCPDQQGSDPRDTFALHSK